MIKIGALIPARIGSKRLINKNILPLGGKPLLFWSIDVALKAGCFSTICVSSESDRVIQLVKSHYPPNEVHTLKRPDNLASDEADLNDVCKHFLGQYSDLDYLGLFMPTYPFRTAQRIRDDLFPPLASRQIHRVVSVRNGNYSTFDFWIRSSNGYERMFQGEPLWCGAGNAAYFFQRKDYFFSQPHQWPKQLGERTLRLQTDATESIDIDTKKDFKIAEKILAGYCQRFSGLTIGSQNDLEMVAPAGVDFVEFRRYLDQKGIRSDLPVLILKPADPLFTFLRWYECSTSNSYFTEDTHKIIANLPASGHSQDFPPHFIHSSNYRVFRKSRDREGIEESSVPANQVIFEDEMKNEWIGYVDPCEWIPHERQGRPLKRIKS